MNIILIGIVITLADATILAQNRPSPAGMWCQYCQPKESVVSSVRTLLSVERREEIPFNSVVETYDTQSRLIESLSHSSGREHHSGQIMRSDSKITYVYDLKGRVLKHFGYSLEKPGEGKDSVTFTYDDSGYLKEQTTLIGGAPFLRTAFSYEPEKRTVIALTTAYVEGRAISPFKAVLVYNEKGQWIKKNMFRADGSPDGVAEFSYNERGSLAEEARYDDDGKYSHSRVFTYKYDSKGNWIERKDMFTRGGHIESGEPPWMTIYRVITYFEEK